MNESTYTSTIDYSKIFKSKKIINDTFTKTFVSKIEKALEIDMIDKMEREIYKGILLTFNENMNKRKYSPKLLEDIVKGCNVGLIDNVS